METIAERLIRVSGHFWMVKKYHNLYVPTTICRHYMPRNMTRNNRAGLGINKYGVSTGLIIKAPGFSQPALKLFFYCI